MIAEAQALRDAEGQQASRTQGGAGRELPRPDIALIPSPMSTELSGDPPAEVTEYLFVLRPNFSMSAAQIISCNCIISGYKYFLNISISSILVST